MNKLGDSFLIKLKEEDKVMKKISLFIVVLVAVFLSQGTVFASSSADKEIRNLQNCLGDCISNCGEHLKCISKCGTSCAKHSFDRVSNLDRCEDLLVPVVSFAVEKTAEKLGCAGVGFVFDAACTAVTAAAGAAGAPECIIGAQVIGFNCGFHGSKYATRNAKNIARDVCDYVFPDSDPYILLSNNLKNKEHKVDFRAIIDAGDDVHMRGDNWVESGGSGILASHKLKGDDFHGTVKAKIKRKGKKDIELIKHDVQPNKHRVFVYHKDGKYHIGKKKDLIAPVVAIENHLKKHKVDFRVVVNNSNDVHLPGNNWLKPGGKAILGSYKLHGNSYKVIVKIKRDGKKDVERTINSVKPGQDKVYVYHKNGKYHIGKKSIK